MVTPLVRFVFHTEPKPVCGIALKYIVSVISLIFLGIDTCVSFFFYINGVEYPTLVAYIITSKALCSLWLSPRIMLNSAFFFREHSNTIHEAITNKHRHKYEDVQEMSNEISGKPFNSLNIEENLINLGRQQRLNTIAIANLSRQLTNTDKLHMSMLELLENVESIENKIDKNFPEFRKEISKLELEAAEAASSLSMLKEEQTNTRESVKAIGVSVSNLQEKVDKCKDDVKGINETVVLLKKSGSLQTSKLHDHILKVNI